MNFHVWWELHGDGVVRTGRRGMEEKNSLGRWEKRGWEMGDGTPCPPPHRTHKELVNSKETNYSNDYCSKILLVGFVSEIHEYLEIFIDTLYYIFK